MKIYFLMAGGLAVVIAVCVGVIHYEAAATREAMRQMARDEIPRGIRAGIEDSIGPAGESNASGKTPKLSQAAGAAGDLLRQIRDTIASPPDDESSDRTAAAKPDAKQGPAIAVDQPDTADANSPPKPDRAARRKPPQPSDMVNDLFDLAGAAARAGDQIGQQALGLSTAEERDWGAQLHAEIIREKKIVHDRALAKRIDKLTAPLLSARKRRDIDYRFTVIKSPAEEINAFSILGGYIYLHTALIDFVKSDGELQFVLAHEIGHVDLGHCTAQLTYTVRASQLATPLAGNMAGILHRLVSLAYSKNEEFAADAYGFKRVIAAGQTRQQALEFPRHIGQYLQDRGLGSASDGKASGSVAGTVANRIQDHFNTHPPMQERIRRLEAIEIKTPAAN